MRVGRGCDNSLRKRKKLFGDWSLWRVAARMARHVIPKHDALGEEGTTPRTESIVRL